MLAYLLAIIPFYVFVYVPISNIIWGAPESSSIVNLNSSFIASNEPVSCSHHEFTTHIISTEPLMIYVENFLSRNESEHLVRISEPEYVPSTISHGHKTTYDPSTRLSEVAVLERDNIVRCIEHRARAFQGWRKNLHIERLRTQKYGPGGHYKHHFDWSGASRHQDRVSTFMVYVWADCEGGGTEFPRVRMPAGREWCRLLNCGDEGVEDDSEIDRGEERVEKEQKVIAGEEERDRKRDGMGITFKPITGNAVFWHNLQANGRGYQETYHAGLPVISGTKVGLNIWSWGSARDGHY